ARLRRMRLLDIATATYGALVLLERTSRWGVPTPRPQSRSCSRAPRSGLPNAPPLLLEEVLRTSEPIMRGEASHAPRFGADPIWRAEDQAPARAPHPPSSEDPGRALDLDNQLVTHAFSDDRLRPLPLLSSQIASSLGNSLLSSGRCAPSDKLASSPRRYRPRRNARCPRH